VIKSDDRLTFPFFQPEIAGNGGIMLVGFAVAINPRVEFALADGKPADKSFDRDVGLLRPCPGEIDNGVSRIMGNPDAG